MLPKLAVVGRMIHLGCEVSSPADCRWAAVGSRTIDIVHGGTSRIVTLDLICPCSNGREMALGLSREDVTELLLDVGVQVDLGNGRDDLVA